MATVATEYFPTNIGQPRFDWASTAVVANKNLLRFTEQFNSWDTGGAVVTANTETAPDGTVTADTIDISVGGNQSRLFLILTAPQTGTYTASVYLKALAGNNDTFPMRLSNNTTNVNVNFTPNINDASWTRVSFSIAASAGDILTFFVADLRAGGVLRQTYAWGAQLELGDTATDYQAIAQPTTSTPLAANPTSNGLLIEEARTNRILWCRDATDAAWVKTNVTAAKDQTGVDGVANAASSLTATANDGTCIQTITLASGSRTGSVYLKRITGTGNVQVSLDGTTYSTVDLSASEWRRIVLSGTVTNPTVGIKLAVSGDAVAMDYGQVEDGAFATTPILTTTATATRALDVVSIGGVNFNSWFNLNKGTFFSTFNILGQTGQQYPFFLAQNVARRFDYRTSNAITFSTSGNASVSTGLGYNAINKIAFSYNSNVIQTNSVNGGASAIVQQFTAEQIGLNLTINNMFLFNQLTGYMSRFTFVPTAATAEGIETLSSK